jgi:glycosyltransferase involved in cell wall biosynthesis
VSVIIPSRNRCELLRRSVQALGGQIWPPNRFEVIVCLDGSTDSSESMLQSLETPFRLRWVLLEKRGAAAARNAGAVLATGDLLVFIDDDIEASPDLIAAHCHPHDEFHDSVVIGYSKPRLPKSTGLFEQGVRSWWEDTFSKMESAGHRFNYTDFLSGNFSIKRDLFERIGGFDERLRCREDYELGWRLISRSVKFHYSRRALGFHYETTNLRRSLERAANEGEADVFLADRHPELIPVLTCLKLILIRWRVYLFLNKCSGGRIWVTFK